MNFESYKQEVKSEQKMGMEYDSSIPAGFEDNMCCNNGMMMSQAPMMGGCAMPVYECPRENICHRYICYEVPQD